MRVSRVAVATLALISGLVVYGLAGRAAAQPSTNTVYVWPGKLYQDNTSDNGLNLREVGTGSFAIVPGPDIPPFGNASAQFTIGPGAEHWSSGHLGQSVR